MIIGYLTSSSTLVHAGWNRFAGDLIAGVERAGHQTVVFTDRVLAHTTPLPRAAVLMRDAVRARKMLAQCDVVHALDVFPSGVIGLAQHAKMPMIVTTQGSYSVAPLYWPAPFGAVARRVVTRASIVTAISAYTQQKVTEATGRSDIKLIRHGIDLQRFLHTHHAEGPPYILSVGQLKPRKGYHISIPAFASVRARIPECRYKIVYDWGDVDYFRALAKEHGVEDAIDFLHRIDDAALIELYRGARVFVQLSHNQQHHFEGFGLIFLEAAASGVPVVGTLGNGIADAVDVGSNGILVPQGNVALAAEAIYDILSDRERWEQMSNASYVWAKQHDLSGVIQQYAEIYTQLVTKS
jgi:phosphatidylinositol alpha-1,6-mannosyltransferase